MSVNLFRILGTIAINTNNAERDLRKVSSSADNARRNVANAGRLIGKAALGIATAIGVTGVAALRAGDDFRQSMGDIQAQTNLSNEEISKLEQGVRDLAMRQGRFNTRAMNGALKTLAIYGRDADEMLALLRYGMVLSNATGGDLTASIELLGMALDKAGKDSRFAGRYMNVFAQLVRETRLPIELLKQNVVDLAPTMNNWSIELEQSAAWLARLKQEGIYGKSATSGLAYVFRDLSTITPEMTRRLSNLGVEVFDINGNFNNGYDVLNQLKGVMKGMNDTELAEFQTELFGANGQTRAVLDALMNTSDEAENFTERMFKAAEGTLEYGVAVDMASKRTGGLREALGRARHFGREFLYTLNDIIGEDIYKWISNAIDGMGEFLERFRDGGDLHHHIERLGDAFIGLIDALGNIIKVITPLILSKLPTVIDLFSKFVNWISESEWAIKLLVGAITGLKSFGVVKTLVLGLKGVLTLLATPVGIVVAAVALLAIGIKNLSKNNEEFREVVTKVWIGIKEAALSIFGSISEFIKGVIQGIRDFWESHGEAFKEAVVNAFNVILNVIKFVMPAIKGWVKIAWNFISNYISAVIEIIKGVIKVFIGIFTGDWAMLWEGIKSILRGALNVVVSIFTVQFEFVLGVLRAVWSVITSIVRGIGNTVANHFRTMQSNVTSIITSIRTRVTDTFNRIRDAIQRPIERARDIVQNAINRIRGFFNFSISWPNIPMPRFSITPEGWQVGDLLRGRIPSLGVEFFAKGGIMNSPTAFGMNGNNIMIGGEAGREAILPLDAHNLAGIGEGIAAFSGFDQQGSVVERQNQMIIEQLQLMNRNLSNLQVVMDDGTLVGCIQNKMDKALQKSQKLRSRAVTI